MVGQLDFFEHLMGMEGLSLGSMLKICRHVGKAMDKLSDPKTCLARLMPFIIEWGQGHFGCPCRDFKELVACSSPWQPRSSAPRGGPWGR